MAAKVQAYKVKPCAIVEQNPAPFTREEVIKKIVECKDYSTEVRSWHDTHLMLKGVCAEVARFEGRYAFNLEVDKKQRITKVAEYKVTIDLPHACLSELFISWVFLKSYYKDWDSQITVTFLETKWI